MDTRLALALVLAVAACGPGAPAAKVTADQASKSALAAYQAQHTSGQTLSDCRFLTVEMGPSNLGAPDAGPGPGGDVWRVNLACTVTEANGTHYDGAAWIDVDPVTGAARIVAEG
jgi:hypothetical protein